MSIHRAKKKTVAKTNIQQLFDDRNGGQIALRGYSYQFLYSCYLVLSLADENTFFCLEGIEDIDQIAVHSQEKAISHIQIKQSKDRQDASFLKPVLKNFLEAYLIDSNRTFKSAPPFQLNKTGFFTLSCQVYSKIMGCDFTEIEDTTSLSTIVELLYSIDPSLNYASKIPLERIWSNPQTYSIECMASLMHACRHISLA